MNGATVIPITQTQKIQEAAEPLFFGAFLYGEDLRALDPLV